MTKQIKLPKRGTPVDDLVCPKCKKKFSECKPKDCPEPDCPNKPKG